ncbi:hypothetical protein CLCR_07800 [Cladophialophora carrionii]|uniref:Uncharacterized protein n=1 Tax=Cladophialophora carrionii TaxID=86049 RepID=A0A1C1CNZ1_9EURO|nr:hypothetical protein CLCR_07800 [Cladophialophora carrionii]
MSADRIPPAIIPRRQRNAIQRSGSPRTGPLSVITRIAKVSWASRGTPCTHDARVLFPMRSALNHASHRYVKEWDLEVLLGILVYVDVITLGSVQCPI